LLFLLFICVRAQKTGQLSEGASHFGSRDPVNGVVFLVPTLLAASKGTIIFFAMVSDDIHYRQESVCAFLNGANKNGMCRRISNWSQRQGHLTIS